MCPQASDMLKCQTNNTAFIVRGRPVCFKRRFVSEKLNDNRTRVTYSVKKKRNLCCKVKYTNRCLGGKGREVLAGERELVIVSKLR